MKQLLVCMLALFSLSAMADTHIPDMKFRRLDTRDGLSNSQVNYIFQDSKGFVWVGTSYGLNRYDGYRFRTFYSDPNDSTTLRNNYVDWIWEDYKGRLWLKQGMNYSIFDPVTEQVNRNPNTELAKWGIKGGVDRFYIDALKRYWVKTYDDGFYCYDPRKKQLTLTPYGYGMNEISKEFWVSSFGDWGGNVLVVSSDGDLACLDGKKGKVLWKDSYMRENGGEKSASYEVYVDKHSNFWIISTKLFIFSQKEKCWYNSLNSYLASRNMPQLPEPMQVWDVRMDRHDRLWLATDHEGVFVLDFDHQEVKQFNNNKFDATSLSENTLKHMMVDKDGSMWIASYRNGLNQYIETLIGFKTLEVGDINTTTEDTQGNYWFGTDNRGIIKYDPQTGESQMFDKSNSGIASNIMVASCSAKDGSVWFGTYNGGLIHIADGRVTNYLASNAPGGLLNNNVWSVTEDRWGNIWIGTLGNGVQKLNPKTGQFETWSSYNTALKENFMTSLSWIGKGWLMAGHSQFYSLINPVNGKVANVDIPVIPGQPAAMASTTCVMEDSRGLVWHGSTAGCCIVDGKTKKQTMLDMNSGLYGSSVVSIVEDLQHTMWVVTEHGLSNVTPYVDENGDWTFTVRNFSTKDGLQQGPYNQRSASLTHSGQILVGGLGGVDVVSPKLLTNVSNKEIPIFSGLKLFGQQMRVGEAYEGHVILDEALDDCRELVLRHNENHFTIQLATDKGEVHNPSRFIYMLEGFSDKWIKTEEVDPNITYMSLHHGNYLLHVRMLNDDGTMGDTEAVLKITITPPLWRTRWMMLLYMLVIAAGAYWWCRRYLKQQRERMDLEQMRREIEKKHWMSEMRKQMATEGGVDQPKQEITEKETDQSPQLEQVDLVPLYQEECNNFVAPKGKNIRLSFFPFADQLIVEGNRLQLREVMEILLANAANFSPSGSKVKVFAEQRGDKAVIRVVDNGVGIPTEVMPHLFEQIVGDDDSPNLHAVFDIMATHHGTVCAEENHGGGTVFVIELPLNKPEEVIEEAVMIDDEV